MYFDKCHCKGVCQLYYNQFAFIIDLHDDISLVLFFVSGETYRSALTMCFGRGQRAETLQIRCIILGRLNPNCSVYDSIVMLQISFTSI